MMTLTEEEIEALYSYFINRAGYISYELDMPIINFIKKLRDHLSKIEEEE